MKKPKLLIVDDDEAIQLSMKWALAQDYDVFMAGDRGSTLQTFRKEKPALVTLDLGLPPQPDRVEEGFRTLAELLAEDPFVKVIIITGQDDKENALEAIGQGAADFFCKPIVMNELKIVLQRALTVHQLESENRELQARVSREDFEELIGSSPQIHEIFVTVDRVATTEVPVLIIGESGTGKELIARAIHRRSGRKEGPFVAINCAAIPENLLESELFGHEKGSFTGAHTQRRGRIETAHKGTLFLDEIGEIPPSLQVKLLRFLQEHSIERVGGRKEILVDARILAATNQDLQKAIAESRFREDLYYRLCVVNIVAPPLRERVGDAILLATAFLQRYAVEHKKKLTGFTPQALQALDAYSWPGNVRELENRIKRAVIMAQKSRLSPEDLQLATDRAGLRGVKLREARENLEREMVLRALSRNRNNLSKAAEELGISRPTLYELMEKLGIQRN
jgi:two-component system, NtrC family, response regulator